MIGGDGGDCGGGDFGFAAGGGGGGEGWVSAPTESKPLDERPKINGEPILEQSHELVIKKNDAQD